jgi:hypothetical protein
LRLEAADTFNAAHAGHVDVHQDHRRFFLRQGGERGFGVFMDADTFETFRAANPLGQNATRRRVVVHDGNGDVHGLYLSPDAFGKIVVNFHDAPSVEIKMATPVT